MDRSVERHFLALWPNAAARTALEALRAGLAGVEGRLMPESNLHITLVFLGATNVEQRRCVERACANIAAEPMEIRLERMRYRARGGIVWIEPAVTPVALTDLVRALEAGLKTCGIALPPRPYRAHMTLARDVRRYSAPPSPAPIVWTARTFCLVRSESAPRGSRYTIEREWGLGRG
ncbi:MAG: RNA 2',3'-cyclic phosphodiesterase [Gammaproteobacteria bacterium]